MNTRIGFYLLSILIFCGFIMTSCNKSKSNAKNDIKFSSIEKKEQYHLLGDTANPACDFEFTFTFPSEYADTVILAKIQEQFILSFFGDKYANLKPDSAAANYTSDYLESYKSLEKDFLSDLANEENAPVGSWYSYYEISSYKITFNRNHLLGYTIEYKSYTGGAHGIRNFKNNVLDLQTGKKLIDEDIFEAGYKEQLSKMIVDKIAANNKLSDPAELENIGYFGIDEIEPNNNFMITNDGLTYIYNEYEIAAYVIGAIHVHFTFEELKPLLKKESPISSLI